MHVLKIPIKYVAALGESMARAWERGEDRKTGSVTD